MTQRGFLADFLAENPDILFQSFVPRGPSRAFSSFARRLQPEVEARFLGGIGREARAGRVPTQTFRDFVRDFDFRREFLGLSPTARGEQRSVLAPRVGQFFR